MTLRQRNDWRYSALDWLGWRVLHTGERLHRFGLWLCGWGGSLHGRADGYR